MPEIKEEALKFGEHDQALAIATFPTVLPKSCPILVIFNAGLLSKSEPFRMNVLAARACAKKGYIAVRIDLSGKGDTPTREGLSNRESVNKDWAALEKSLCSRFGKRTFILMGLCSGADNAIKIAAQSNGVRGLILLDPKIPQDTGYMYRHWHQKVTSPQKWLNISSTLSNRVRDLFSKNKDDINVNELRDLPTEEELNIVCKKMAENNGRVLSFFTSFALPYYNKKGQFVSVANTPNFECFCDEYWWPHIDHVYSVQSHREQLINTIECWCEQHLQVFQQEK